MMKPGGREHCALCGRSWGYGLDRKLDRHEPWGGANRVKSKRLGMWVLLCHYGCHKGPGSVHGDAEKARQLRRDAQRAAMLRYGWTREEFIRQFGKSELNEEECLNLLPKATRRAVIEAARGPADISENVGETVQERIRRLFPENEQQGTRCGGFRALTDAALPY